MHRGRAWDAEGCAFDRTVLRRLAVEAGLGAAAIHLRALDSGGPSGALPADGPIYPASMIKTPLAVATAVAVAAGRARWDESLVVTPAVMTVNDAPSPLVPGARASVAEVLALMIARSDNVATNLLFDRLDRRAATADIAALGFPGTAFARKLSGALPLIEDPGATGRNTHPPDEACALFARLAAGSVPGADLIGAALRDQYWNGKLSLGLAPGDAFAHKTGDTDDVSHDGGILTLASGERFALAVYTTLPATPGTDACFGAFMRALRPWLSEPSGGSRADR